MRGVAANLRVGIIGVGWGSLVLAPAFGVAQGYEVAALCSRQEQRVQAAAAKLGIAQATTDWRELIQQGLGELQTNVATNDTVLVGPGYNPTVEQPALFIFRTELSRLCRGGSAA